MANPAPSPTLAGLKTRFIFNPRSGHNARNPWLLDRARAFIAEHRLDATVVATGHPRHATELARQAVDEGCRRVVAIGGDGTMNEIAAALVGTEAALGLIPCGSGNGLGRHLGIPGPGRGAFQTLLTGRIRTIDTGVVNGLPFFNAMGAGFDAEISARFNHLVRRGLPAYIRTGWSAWREYQPFPCRIRGGGTEHQVSAFLVAVGNSDQYGNDCFITPGARVDDGRLNLTVLRDVGLLSALPLGFRLFTRRLAGTSRALLLEGPGFTIERAAPGLIHTDGEIHETAATLEISVRPSSLRIQVPSAL